ncbi:Zinc/iron-chelating domain-containing protein [Candidatus Desulfarcum epimagneticum]|uniref:Zinc/iron-chelating domain-containing protein n=1 Tax=uncultured Desulfobacteraceae bacterium TaxID=218296 RepID=A0A484HKU4_9BACT|nr:Zinc/iron-chelating domain-containing protein [uncultured Desulfobacteraceae bacterium]
MTSKRKDDVFECAECGECCKGFGGTFVTPGDMEKISAYIHCDPRTFAKKYCRPSGKGHVIAQGENGYCVFWKNKKCGVHPVKPRMCREWPFIPAVLKRPGNWRIMAGACPGIRAGAPADQIKKRVKETLAGRRGRNKIFF